MTKVLDITIQFGDFFREGDNNWWLDLLNTIIGAAIGTGATIWALYRTFKNDKHREEIKRLEFQKEKIKYLQSLIRSVQTGLHEQILHFKSYAEKIKQNPIELPLLTVIPLNELERIVHKIDQEDYYHSYLGEFGDNQTIIDEFRDIISTLNYFDGNLTIIKSSLQKSFEFDHERKVSLKNMIEKASDDAASTLIDPEISKAHRDFWDLINNLMLEFHSKKPEKADLQFHHDNFVEPLKQGLLKFTKTLPFAHYLIIQLKNSTVLYFSIQTHNLQVAEDFENWYTVMSEEYQKLLNRINRLLSYNS